VSFGVFAGETVQRCVEFMREERQFWPREEGMETERIGDDSFQSLVRHYRELYSQRPDSVVSIYL